MESKLSTVITGTILDTKYVLVIGAGVEGLTTTFLLKEGLKITIISEKSSPDTISNVAGALWDWTPVIYRHHRGPISLEGFKDWCMVSYKSFEGLAQAIETGVKILDSVFLRHSMLEDDHALFKMKGIEVRLNSFKHNGKLIEEIDVKSEIDLKDGDKCFASVVDTDIYLKWLTDHIVRLGFITVVL